MNAYGLGGLGTFLIRLVLSPCPGVRVQLQDLQLERLSARRVRLCKTFAERTATDSRHMDMFTPVTSARRLGTYREIYTRTATYYKSALPYLTRLLNQ